MYPKEDKENYQVLQFASQAAGSQGLATYVQQISETAIKVLVLPMRWGPRSNECSPCSPMAVTHVRGMQGGASLTASTAAHASLSRP